MVNGVRLHYLDWGGSGSTILFLAGMGCNAYIYDQLAPRFTDHFHAVGLTRRGHGDSDHPPTGYDINTLVDDIAQAMTALTIDEAVLIGHSFAGLELTRFAARFPDRVLKLVYVDAAFDYTSPSHKVMREKNPLSGIQPPGLDDEHDTAESYVASLKKAYPALAAIWGPLMDEQILHEVTQTPEGKFIDRMSEAISTAMSDTVFAYVPEFAKIEARVLSFFVDPDSAHFAAADYLTEVQKARVREFIDILRPPYVTEFIEQFRGAVPDAQIVRIPKGHHYCFISHEDLVFDETQRFLMQ